MGLCKAAGVMHTRTLLRAKGDKVEQAFLAQLSEREQKIYNTAMPVSMLELVDAQKMYELAVPLIYTGCTIPDGLDMLGYDNAKNDLRGMYKILLPFVTPDFMVKQTAKIWKTYHSKGNALSEKLNPKHYRLTLLEYPEIPNGFEYIVEGYIRGMMDMAGAKNPTITHDLSDRNAITWQIRWD